MTAFGHEYYYELVNDSVMIRSMDGIINFWNQSAEKLYGWKKEEVIGRVSHNLLRTQFPKPLEEIESELLRNGLWEGKLVHTTRDGGRVVVESRWALKVDDQSGAVVEVNMRAADREMEIDTRADFSASIDLPVIGQSSLLKTAMARLHAPVYQFRIRELVRCIAPHLREGDRVLDVGCGFGALGRAILDSPLCPRGVHIRGLERGRRDGSLIGVDSYDGITIPYAEGSYDVVLLADVLHHEREPERLLHECIRVSRRFVIIKDHQLQGLLAWQRISLLDWAANHPYGAACIYEYKTPAQWVDIRRRHQLSVVEELRSMRLYPCGLNWVFGGRLQYLAVLRVPEMKKTA